MHYIHHLKIITQSGHILIFPLRPFVPLPLSFIHATAPAARTCNSPTMAKARRGSDSQRLEKVPNIIASRAKRCLGGCIVFFDHWKKRRQNKRLIKLKTDQNLFLMDQSQNTPNKKIRYKHSLKLTVPP